MLLDDHTLTNEVLIALRRIIQAIDLYSRSLKKHHGITGPQLVILQELSKNSEISNIEYSILNIHFLEIGY